LAGVDVRRELRRRRRANVPYHADNPERSDQIVAEIELLPAKALVNAALIMVVVVVPPFAERHVPIASDRGRRTVWLQAYSPSTDIVPFSSLQQKR
jgi:hypothetical protein